MKIKPEYSLAFELDEINILHTDPAGTVTVVGPISDTAAMAWDGIARDIPFDTLVEAIVNEFAGATKEQVAADLKALMAQLAALGYAEE